MYSRQVALHLCEDVVGCLAVLTELEGASEPHSGANLVLGYRRLLLILAALCNGSSDSTQLYTDVIRISMILRCTLVQ